MPEKKIASHIIMPISYLEAAPEDVGENWERGMDASAEEINEKRKARIKDEGDYLSRVASASCKVWHEHFAEGFVSRAGLNKQEIVARQAENMAKSYAKYDEGLEAMFKEDAKGFKGRIKAGKPHYLKGAGQKVIALTGSPRYGRGPAAMACLWLTNDTIAEGEVHGGYQILEGGPFLITTLEIRPAFKSALNARLIQAGATIIETKNDPVIMKRQNDITNRIVNGFVDPALNLVPFATGGPSRIDYILQTKESLALEIQVTRK